MQNYDCVMSWKLKINFKQSVNRLVCLKMKLLKTYKLLFSACFLYTKCEYTIKLYVLLIQLFMLHFNLVPNYLLHFILIAFGLIWEKCFWLVVIKCVILNTIIIYSSYWMWKFIGSLFVFFFNIFQKEFTWQKCVLDLWSCRSFFPLLTSPAHYCSTFRVVQL